MIKRPKDSAYLDDRRLVKADIVLTIEKKIILLPLIVLRGLSVKEEVQHRLINKLTYCNSYFRFQF
ncbi:hypothetical protein Dd703_3259 [Musicola paradisiaca Ech703]|uniref:Uncharacterized protein n=1 Tax=Musicola paradisiaca (strain Ech703) TaxID=579405 RepID=C6CDF0_MUSP7|nr:hypothetical protein Dd703_3259 [Musicola paradisiaca Ech703]